MREYRTLGLRLMVICFVAVLALAAVNALTAPIIEARKGGGPNQGEGVISASAAGFSGGEVTVTVTFNDDGTIAAVTADLSTQTPASAIRPASRASWISLSARPARKGWTPFQARRTAPRP